MTIQQRLETVNEGTLFICFCMFSWILLLAARADEIITLPYWAVFSPLWVWKLTVFIGWLTGLIVWYRQRRHSITPNSSASYIYEDPALPHIQAMSVSTFFTLLLACSEILLCIHLTWRAFNFLTILTPLMLVGLLGIFGFFFVMIDSRSVMSWTRRHHGRISARLNNSLTIPDDIGLSFTPHRVRCTCSFTLELFIAANLLQLLLLVAHLDNWIRPKWLMTFIPTFILLGISFLFCTIGFFIALIRYFLAIVLTTAQRRIPIVYYASHILINVLLCCTVVCLGFRLDDKQFASQASYTLICAPVLLSLVLYAITSFYLGPGNPWWFGLNRNILLALFETCPALQLCANTSVTPADLWKSPADHESTVVNSAEDVVDSNSMISHLVNPPYDLPVSNLPIESESQRPTVQTDSTSTGTDRHQLRHGLSESTETNRDVQPLLSVEGSMSGSKPTEYVHHPD